MNCLGLQANQVDNEINYHRSQFEKNQQAEGGSFRINEDINLLGDARKPAHCFENYIRGKNQAQILSLLD